MKQPNKNPGLIARGFVFFLTLPLVGRVDSEAVGVGVFAMSNYPHP
jgi:hypothetical protein